MTIGFNKEWAKKVGKQKFVAHFKKIYPELDLSKTFDSLVPSKKPVEKQ